MRNLKKLLSVVLVVAMIAGLCAVGSFSAAAAEYSETTNYKEAAAVITGVGVMDGYEDGTMQYDKTVTREEAAAIICRALIGVDTAKKLSTAVAPFADVAANRWSAPFINYLKSQGIVNGKTATQFDPTAEVTAVEFAKMMLCAVGYGKAGEFVGASWDVNTITAANNNGIYTSTLAADLTAPATREQCMLYAYNTMTRVPVVNYNNAFQSYYVGNSVVSNILTRVDDDLIGNSAAVVGIVNNPYPYTLAYRNFKLERTDVGSDDYGRPAVKWTANGKAIVQEVCSKSPNYTLYGAVTSKELYDTLGKAVVNDINNKTLRQYMDDSTSSAAPYSLFTIYTNGIGPTLISAIAATPPYTAGTDIKSGESMVNKISDAGDTVELYVSEKNGIYAVKAVVYKQYFAQVTKIDTAANKLYATVYTNTGKFSNCVADGDDVNINGLKKDDYILVNMNNASNTLANGSFITAITTPKSSVGTYKGTTFLGLALDIDGVSTNKSSAMDNGLAALTSGDIGNQYTFWYDSLGNVIYYKFYDAGEAAGTTSYFYVISAEADDGSSILNGTNATLVLDVVYTTGGEEVVKVLVNKDTAGKYFTIGTDKIYFGTAGFEYENGKTFTKDYQKVTLNNALAGKFYSFTKTSDNFVKISTPNNQYAKQISTATTAANRAAVTADTESFSATTSTVFTVIDAKGNVNTYTGYTKFPDDIKYNNFSGAGLITYSNGSNKLKTICFYDAAGIAGTPHLALCGSYWSTDAEGDHVFFFVDGEYKMITLPAIPGASMFTYPANTVYELTLSDNGNTAKRVTAYFDGKDASGNAVTYDMGLVNEKVPFVDYSTATNIKGSANALLGLGHTNSANGSIDEYYAWSTINDVDGNAFTTKAVKAGEVDTRIYPFLSASDEIKSLVYYFDGNSKIYDCRNNTCTKLTELPEGVVFIAYVNEDSKETAAYKHSAYCEYIWIVG